MSILAHWLTWLAQPFGLDGPARIALGAGLAGLGLAGLVSVLLWRGARATRAAWRGGGGTQSLTSVASNENGIGSASAPAPHAEPVGTSTMRPFSVSRPLPETLTEVVARPARITVPSRPIFVARGETTGDLPPAGGVAVAERPRQESLDLRGLVPVDGAMEGLDLLDPPKPGTTAPDERPAVAGDAAAWEQYQRGLALLAGASGEAAEALDEALACFRRAQAIWTREAAPERWATVENDIGRAYLLMPGADRAAHVRAAIEHHEAALEVFDPIRHKMSWAWTQSALGAAYQIRPVGSALANARAAVAYHKRALDVFTRQNAPLAWAWNKNNLGAAYETMRGGAEGEWVASLRAAETCYEEALEVYTRDAYPLHHQIVTRNLERVRAELSLLD